jgi:flotillin
MFDPLLLVAGASVVTVSGAVGSLVLSCYQKCGPNQAMIISGLGCSTGNSDFMVVIGGGAVVWPVIQQRAFLSLELMTIDLKNAAPIITKSGIPVLVEAIAQCKVKSDDKSIILAAEHFLNKNDAEIMALAHESLVGNLRTTLGAMEVEDAIRNMHEINQRVQEASNADLGKMGMTVVSFTVRELTDTVGYLEKLAQQKLASAAQ